MRASYGLRDSGERPVLPEFRLPLKRAKGPILISVWDLDTYDGDIQDYLNRHQATIRLHRERALELDNIEPPRDLQERIRFRKPTNEHYPAYMAARDGLAPILESKSFRAFHYTRMTDSEVERILRAGIRTTSLDLLNERLQSVVEEKLLKPEIAETIYRSSALHSPHEYGDRRGFWTTACPIDVTDSAVDMLVGHWGGESSYFPFMGGAEDEAMLSAIQGIGRGRILEIEVPMSSTQGVGPHSATKTMFDVVERSFGHENSLALDFNSLEPLPPSAIIRVISEGEAEFDDVATAFGYTSGE
ncbi:hypothetical protein ACVMH6_007022 [Rhizobium leguminosarum]